MWSCAVGANGFGTPAHFNMRANGGVSPHHGNFRGTSYRPNSGLQPSGSSKRHGGGGGHSGTVGGTPVSPLGVPIGSSGAFPPNPLSGPAELSRGHTGTPPADASGLSNPFSWNAEGGHSAPLSQLQFADAAHKAVHDEVMKVWSGSPCAQAAWHNGCFMASWHHASRNSTPTVTAAR